MGAAASLEELAKAHAAGDGDIQFDAPENWRIDHARSLHKQFKDGAYDFGVDRDTFDRLLAEGVPAAADAAGTFWRKFDTNDSLLINVLELLSGVAVMSMGTVEEKIEFLFDVNDFNGTGSLSYDELVVLLYVCAAGTVLVSGKGVLPEEHAMEAIADEAFVECDLDISGRIDRPAFTLWILDYMGITEETPTVGLREFLKRMKSLKHVKTSGAPPGAVVVASSP